MLDRVLNKNMTENLGQKNKPMPVTCERIESPLALMGIPDGDGFTAFFLINKEDVTDWLDFYNSTRDPQGYREIPFDDYTEFFPWTRNR